MTRSIFRDRRRLLVWPLVVLYGLVASGLPLPVARPPAGTAAARKLADKDRRQPFPCMDKPCGCDSAERCFSNCCCHTPAETLRWAEARGIEPAVLATLQRRVAAAAPAPPPTSCRAEAPRRSCCSAEAADAAADDAICSDYQSLAGPSPTSERAMPSGRTSDGEQPPGDEPTAKVVILRAMLACGGITAQWAAACVSLPPPATVTCEIPWPCVAEVTTGDDAESGTSGPPDLPPPRA